MTDEPPPHESAAERDEGSSLLARLVAECLDRVAEEGPAAVDAFCREHAEHADAVRRRMETLQQMGLLDVGPADGDEHPEEVGPFHLIRRLGSGGMGVVYLAEQRPLGRTVALKLMRPDQVFFQGSRQRFQREVLAVARLHHPGIVAVHTAGEEGGVPYFAMEYVRGCSLAEALKGLRPRQPADLSAEALLRAVAAASPAEEEDGHAQVELAGATWAEVCLRLALQVADALAHAHESGIHHRDIKPSNVMVTRAGRAMLLDFGLASASGTSRLTQSGSQLGSLPYMAPESLEGGPSTDGARADVYSLGVLLYELLTLHSPFLDENPTVTIRKVLAGGPDPVRLRYPGVPWAAETVCQKAMDHDPARRYASAAELARDLRNALEHRPLVARRPGPWLRARRWSRRHPARAVAALAGVLLLGASVAYGLAQRSTNRALTRALLELETRNTELDAALAEVDESFGRVVDAGVRMLSRVGFDILQDVPLSDAVRRELLDESQRLALVLQRDEPTDPHLRFEMARTLRLLGQFRGDMGEYEQGDEHLRQAAGILEHLLAEDPGHEQALLQLVRTDHGLGASLLQRFQNAQAAQAFQAGAAAGLAGLERLEASGASAESLAELRTVTALALQGAGTCLHYEARLEEADEAFREARRQLGLVAGPFHEEQQEALAVCSINHATLLVALGRTAEAQEALRAGIAELRDMLGREPGNAANRANLGRTLEFLGSLLPKGDPEALAVAQQAVEELRRARRDSPGSAEAIQGLASALSRLGSEQMERELRDEARASLEEAVAVLRSLLGGQSGGVAEALVVAQIRLAECLAAGGDPFAAEDVYRAAVDACDRWLDDPDTDLSTRSHTVVVLESFARFLSDHGMAEEAAPHARRALEESRRQIEERPEDPRMVAQLSTLGILVGRIELELGNPGTTTEVLESLLDATLDDDELLQAAALASGCIEAADEGEDLVGRGVALALAFLDRVQDVSLLAADGALGNNGEFGALRARPEFGEWVSRR